MEDIKVRKRNITSRNKLKALSQEERIHLWKERFKNLLGKPHKVTDKPITKIINNQLDIKLRQFTQKVDVILTKIKKGKPAGLDEKAPEVCKTKKLVTSCSDTATPFITRIQ